MRITLINQFYVPDISPTAHLTASLAEGFAGAGHEVTVIASAGGYVAKAGTTDASSGNPRIHRIWTPQLGKKSIWRRCADYGSFYSLAALRAITLPAQDVIISLTTPPYIAWIGAIHRFMHRRTKLVLWNMDCYPDAAERAAVIKKGGMLSRTMRWMNRALFRRLDHLICLDEAMRELLVSQYAPRGRTNALPTTIIPNWEKSSLFPANGRPPRWNKAHELGLDGKFVVLYMGNMGVGHPFEAVIEAAKRLGNENVMFLFVGGGERWEWLRQAVDREKLDNLILHGYVPKEASVSVIATADCGLITLGQNMAGVMSPSKLHANLALGLPIIYVGPEQSNVDEAIRQFNCGVTLRDGDVEGIIQFIRNARQNALAFTHMKQAARRAFDAAYCDTQTLPQFERVIKSL